MINEKQMMHGLDYLSENVSGWLMSEKLDGCRAYWDGSTMWSRGGKAIAIPDVMRRALPSGIQLDGELFAGRDGFEIVRRFVQYDEWNNLIEFCAFDAPLIPGCFSVRYSWLENHLPFEGIVNYVAHQDCVDYDDALSFMADVQDCYQGEGVVLRDPLNFYRSGRTDQVLKLKKAVE